MIDIILFAVIAVILIGAGLYVYKAKKRGDKCIGCPYAKECKKSSCNFGK